MSHSGILRSILGAAFALVLAVPAQAAGPLVIGHRGASGYLPEHTLGDIRQGAVLCYTPSDDPLAPGQV